MEEDKKIWLKVITPVRILFDQAVDFVVMRGIEGDMGILYGHGACSALLDYGMLRIFSNNKEIDVLTVLGGFVTVLNNEVTVLSDMAEHPDKLQEVIDKIAEDRAANRLKEQSANLDMHRAELVLRRTLVHMDISSYAIMGGHDELKE